MKNISLILILFLCTPQRVFSMNSDQPVDWKPGDIVSNPGQYVKNGRTMESLGGLKVGDFVGVAPQHPTTIAALVLSIQHPPEWNPDLGMSLVLQRSADENDMIPALTNETVNLKYLMSQAS